MMILLYFYINLYNFFLAYIQIYHLDWSNLFYIDYFLNNRYIFLGEKILYPNIPKFGGTFQIALDAKTGKVVNMIHDK